MLANNFFSRRLDFLGYLLLLFVVGKIGWLVYNDNLIFESDIRALLPETEKSLLVKKVYDRVSSEWNSRAIILVQGKDSLETDSATDYFMELFDQARAQQKVSAREAIETGFDGISDRINAMSAHKEKLLADNSIERMQDSADGQLRWRMNRVIAFPSENITDPVDDPLGTLEDFLLERMPEFRGAYFDGLYLRVNGDVSANLIVLEFSEDDFGDAQVNKSVQWINDAKELITQKFDVEIYRSGVAFHATAIKDHTIKEVRWMTLLIIAITLGIFLYVTKSVRALLISTISIVLAIAGGLAFSSATVGLPHLIGLAVAITAIGICIDFSLHFWIHVRTGMNGMEAIKAIRPGITLSFLTTAVSLLVVAAVSVQALSRPIVFILGALLVSWVMLLLVIPRLAKNRAGLNSISDIKLPEKWLTVLVLAIATASAVGLALKYHTDDDPVRLGYRIPHLVKDDLTIKKTLKNDAEPGIYLVQAESADEMLEIEAGLFDDLSPAEAADAMAVSRLVPPQDRQLRNQLLYKEAIEHTPSSLLQKYLAILGAPSFNEAINFEKKYTLAWVTEQPWSSLERNHIIQSDKSLSASTIRAWGGAVKKLDVACLNHANCSRVSLSEYHTSAFKSLRVSFGWGLLLAFGSIFCILYIRYQKQAFRLIVVPVLASVSGLATVAWAGMPVTAFTLAAMFPLLGLSIDYIIFTRESANHPAPTFLAISASALTTALSFLVLSFSNTPAIQYFSLPIAAGILVAWITVQLART